MTLPFYMYLETILYSKTKTTALKKVKDVIMVID